MNENGNNDHADGPDVKPTEMASTRKRSAVYQAPTLQSFGTIAVRTQARRMSGGDGGTDNKNNKS